MTDPAKRTNSRPFHFGCSTDLFLAEEIQALNERGHRMEALASGAIRPATPEDKHFVKVDREEAEPQTLDERAWLRLKGRREFEGTVVPPTTPDEDYGIVEWDKEKCWW
jgi:uncharacterized protein YifE (UPF0438 family)